MTEVSAAKQRIRDAFLQALEQSPYSRITMTGLASSLGMSRQSLYKQYTSKAELLEDIASSLSENVIDQTLALMDNQEFIHDTGAWSATLQLGLDVMRAHPDLMRSMADNDMKEASARILHNMVTRILGHLARINQINITDHDYFKLVAVNISSAVHAVLSGWALSGMIVPTAQVRLLLLDSANPAVLEKLRFCSGSAPAIP